MEHLERQEDAILHLFSSTGVADERILDLLMASVGRVLRKERRDLVGHSFAEHFELLRMTRHIRDWLTVAVADEAKWLSNVDEFGRPKKLLKFATVEAISSEADRHMERKQRLSGKTSMFFEGEEEFVFDAGDGWSIVRLITPTALDRESEVMQHCIGHGGYDDALGKEGVSFLSLRDPHGNPHVTMEVAAGKLEQFQGKQNKSPLERYTARCLPYFNAEKISSHGIPQLVTDVNGLVYSVYNLPEVLDSDSHVDLRNDTDRPLRLPRVIRTKLSLRITGNAFSNTPDEVSVGGLLHIAGSALASVPCSLSVGKSIILSGMKDVVLPSDLRVEGSLILTGSTLKSFPKGLFVRDMLGLEGTDVSEIPDDLRCGGIDISRTSIKRFNTAVFQSDDLEKPTVGDLTAIDSGLEDIVGTPHFGSLTVGGSQFETPDGLVVDGKLTIIGGTARITVGTKSVGGLEFTRCDVDVDIEDVVDTLTVRGSRVRFRSNLRCGGAVSFRKSEIVVVPDHIECETLILQGSTLPALPTEIIATKSVVIPDEYFPRLSGTIKTEELRIPSSTTFLGDGIRAESVTITKGFISWKMGLAEIKAILADVGDLHTLPDNAMSTFPSGSGKSNFLSSAFRSWIETAIDGPNSITYETPIEYVTPLSNEVFAGR